MLDQDTLYLQRVGLSEDPPENAYYANLPAVRHLQKRGLELTSPITILVGENGTGKSTLIEAIAVALGFNAEGGTKNFSFESVNTTSGLHEHLKLQRGWKYPKDGFFLRAEGVYNMASYIDSVQAEHCYGGISLHDQSHGESFLAIVENRFWGSGIYVLDEPEAALSPMRTMRLMTRMHELVERDSQFVIATHSPILMAYPGAQVLELTEDGIEVCDYAQTEHFAVMKQFMNAPERMCGYLFGS